MSGETTNKKFKKMSESERTADYDHATQKVLEEIDVIQNQLDSINEKASEEILQIERKYNRLRKPHYEKRNQLISNIPNFWVTAIMNHPDISNLFNGQEEEDCLHHLTKIEVDEFDDILSGFYIKFYFDENPYFENSVLTKEYHLGNELDPRYLTQQGEFIVGFLALGIMEGGLNYSASSQTKDAPTSKSTQITWKEGIQLGQTSQDTNIKTNRKRRLESTKTSFFTWFNDNVDPYTDDIAEDFKDDLWLNPIQYFLVADGQEEENWAEGEEESSSDDNEESVDPENQTGSNTQGNSSNLAGRPV